MAMSSISRLVALAGTVVILLPLLDEQGLQATPRAASGGVTIGCFCLDGVRGHGDPTRSTPTLDGIWVPWTYEVDPRARSSARLFFFDRALPTYRELLTCDEIAARASEAGIQLLLAGRLKALTKLDGALFNSSAGGGNRFQIEEGKLVATLSRVQSGALSVAGGTMPLAGSMLWIENTERLLATSDGLMGTLQIEAWNRQLLGAKVTFPGGSSTTVDLAPVRPDTENVTVHLNLATGHAKLWQASLRTATVPPVDATELGLGAIVLHDAALRVRGLTINAADGLVTGVLDDLQGGADAAVLERSTDVTRLSQPTLSAKRAQASVETPADNGFALSALSLTDTLLESDRGEVRTRNDIVAILGAVRASFQTLGANALAGHLEWTRPALPALTFLFPNEAVETLRLEVDGDLDELSIRGDISAARFSLGSIDILHALSAPFDLGKIVGQVRIPFAVSIPSVSSSFALRDADQEVTVSATIIRGYLAGALVLHWPDLEDSHLEVPPDSLHLTLSSTVVTKPFVAGTRPAFGSAEVHLSNPTELVAGKQSTGSLELGTDFLALGQPILRVGEKGKASRATLSLQSEGAVRLGYDLATHKASLVEGELTARGVEISLLDPAATIDVSGTLLTSPRIGVEVLSLRANASQALFEILGLSINAAQASHPRSPDRPAEVSFEATPTAPIKLETMEGSAAIGDSIALRPITFRGLHSEFHNASVQFGTDFAVRGARLAMGVELISVAPDTDPVQYAYKDLSLQATGRLAVRGQVHINADTEFEISATASGSADRLNGDGTAKIGSFTGWTTSAIPAKAFCQVNVPVEYNYKSGGAVLHLEVDDGHFAATGNLRPLAVLLKSTSGASCDTAPEDLVIVPEKKISMTGICCAETKCALGICGCVRYKTCEWYTTIPKVALRWHKRFEVHGLGATALLTNPRIRLEDEKLQVCNLGTVSVASSPGGALLLGGVSPQIDSSVPNVDAIINNTLNPLISGSFALAESAVTTSIANGVGLAASTLATPAGNAMCLTQ